MTTKLDRLTKQKKELILEVQVKKLNRIKAQYDAIAGSGQNTGAGNKRRPSKIETTEETGARGILKPRNRLSAINLARDAERNYSNAKSIIHQNKINIIGKSPKCQINTADKFGVEATEWINSDWMKNCDFRSTRRFAKLGQLVVAGQDREGDLLALFDDEMIDDTGKLLFYESDQITDLADFTAWKGNREKWQQRDGIIYDEWSREVGYVTTHRRGQSSIPARDATVFPRDPVDESKNMVKLIRADFRLIQGRGISPMLTIISDMLDCYEMRSKELQSAKLQASLAGTIQRKEAIENFDDARFDPDNQNADDSAGVTNTLPEEQTAPENYERLEKLTGGYFDYLAEGDEFKLHDIKRPNVKMKEFLDYVLDSAGSAFGLAHAYTRMKADTSYTAFRGDMVMTWVTWYARQKDLENEFLDWSAIRAIKWAIRKGFIKRPPTPGWEKKVSWMLPRMPFVDEGKERDAQAKAVKNGLTTYTELLGPTWQRQFEQLGKELDDARQKALPLEAFETKSGGIEKETETNSTEE